MKKRVLGGFEEIVLRSIMRIREDAYGVPIRRAVEELSGQHSSYGAIYTTLERLEEKGYVKSRQGEKTPERGGRAKRYFEVTGHGVQALHELEEIRSNFDEGTSHMWSPAGGAA